ncbi:MAG: A/G-specific adenine glycosylase [Rhodocyclaceae bacterium]|nr:A/G-specific adenine glycosylase [Rhodocyclaceae bacterium]
MAKDIATRLLAWHKRHGRHDLPWQNTTDPYRVWLSEIMLQQTQVATVIPYYQRFLERFPNLAALAAAPVAEVMSLWSGLGYYARARNLHCCARKIVEQHGGAFPDDPVLIAALPGIGRSTANAIAAFCFDARVPILDGNVKRVLARCFGIEGFPGAAIVEKQMWALAESLLPLRHTALYIQAQMDLGATLCTRSRPRCTDCPLAEICVARQEERQTSLPAPRPKKALPTRERIFLVLLDGPRVLLERRPPSGIWGGLLSLPELPEGAEATSFARRLGVEAAAWEELPALRHTFSHFHLVLRPFKAQATPVLQTREGSGLHWENKSALAGAALPAPIRTLLAMAM